LYNSDDDGTEDEEEVDEDVDNDKGASESGQVWYQCKI